MVRRYTLVLCNTVPLALFWQLSFLTPVNGYFFHISCAKQNMFNQRYVKQV